MAPRKRQTICPHCKEPYRMGENGTLRGCDKCTGDERDLNGYAWQRGQTEMTLMDVETKAITVVTRDQAFGRVVA